MSSVRWPGVAVVTGASSGIGRAIAMELACRGARLALLGREPSRLPLGECSSQTGQQSVRGYAVDLAGGDLDRLADQIVHDFGAIDALIHCAGVFLADEGGSPADFDRMWRVNLDAPQQLTQALLDQLIQQQREIIFINSSAALRAGAGTQYARSKHGLKVFADGLRDEVNQFGVRVVSLFPGRTATPMQESIHAAERREYRPAELIQASDVAQTVGFLLSLPRTVEVTEIMLRPLKKHG